MDKDCRNSNCVEANKCLNPSNCEVNKDNAPVSRFSDDETFSPMIVRKGF